MCPSARVFEQVVHLVVRRGFTAMRRGHGTGDDAASWSLQPEWFDSGTHGRAVARPSFTRIRAHDACRVRVRRADRPVRRRERAPNARSPDTRKTALSVDVRGIRPLD
jgi:hypothetical protein